MISFKQVLRGSGVTREDLAEIAGVTLYRVDKVRGEALKGEPFAVAAILTAAQAVLEQRGCYLQTDIEHFAVDQ